MEIKKNNDCNRSIFARMVLPAFVCAHIYNSDIRTVYSKFMTRLNSDMNSDHRAQNAERRKILENCLTLFTNVKMKRDLDSEIRLLEREINKAENRFGDDERKPSHGEIAKRIMTIFPERLFGDNKRTYDMSYKYSSGILASKKAPDGTIIKGVRCTPNANVPGWSLQDEYGRTISFSPIGKLHYLNGFGEDGYIDQFNVTISRADFPEDQDEYVVFTNIDFSKIEEDYKYRAAVVKELLNKNNIELSNASGYIGEIVNTEHEKEHVPVGEESDQDGGFYRYQVSEQYALMYDPEHLSAVVDYENQKKAILEQSQKNTESR